MSLADKVRKDQRVTELEDLGGGTVPVGGRRPWEEFLEPDELLARSGEGAAERVAYQGSHLVR